MTKRSSKERGNMEENKNQFCNVLPVDAAGNIVPLDTVCLYDLSNIEYRVSAFQFLPSTKKWMVEVCNSGFFVNVNEMCLTKDGFYGKLKKDIYHLVMSEYLDDPEGDVDRIVDRIKDFVDGHQD